MERFLIALDCTPGPLRSVHYVNRVLRGAVDSGFVLFHVLPTASPNLLKRAEVQRLESLQEESPRLRGYFWKREDEERMDRTFREARQLLIEGGFAESGIVTHFALESDEIAQIIFDAAREMGCSTVVVGRRRLSRVKELLLGSVSNSLVKLARGISVWVVDY
ncbi:universal stress protein [Syntrophobacter fumaroxidans]|uniref:UspA domain protein n=1 Tax=Syntrophobacter fumaroxidans (strain DSM 10017 / MPOB) TaxID=335543 RepID=A0LEN1_SYNFM|nr:universal stress protein [Syntrophobacter fumaroxidans]ABK15883.1 UspA domain protein [Syntrophobacter fumaroxidans MPOB]